MCVCVIYEQYLDGCRCADESAGSGGRWWRTPLGTESKHFVNCAILWALRPACAATNCLRANLIPMLRPNQILILDSMSFAKPIGPGVYVCV